jgi:hypothetical protein
MPRPFNREALNAHATKAIRASVGIGAMVWRFTVLVPLEETSRGAEPRQIATDDDIDSLEDMLTTHFQGLTTAPISTGYGLRAGAMEVNTHHPMIVYAAPIAAAEHYFAALRRELQDALDQELILVERQEVWLQ